jgi:hypothetical protein
MTLDIQFEKVNLGNPMFAAKAVDGANYYCLASLRPPRVILGKWVHRGDCRIWIGVEQLGFAVGVPKSALMRVNQATGRPSHQRFERRAGRLKGVNGGIAQELIQEGIRPIANISAHVENDGMRSDEFSAHVSHGYQLSVFAKIRAGVIHPVN